MGGDMAEDFTDDPPGNFVAGCLIGLFLVMGLAGVYAMVTRQIPLFP